jgi:hypothetical protein
MGSVSRTSKRRHEQRRRSRSGTRRERREAVPSLDDVCAAAFAAASGLADEPEPAVAEALASSLFAQWMGAELNDADPVLVFGTAMVDFLARDASPDALALLAALYAVDPMVIELDCARAIGQLRAAGVRRPDWFDSVGTACFEWAWVATDVFDDQDFLVGRFTYGGEAAHDLCVLVDHNILHIAKDLGLAPEPLDLRSQWEALDGIRIVDLDAQGYSDRLSDALDSLEHVWEPPVTDELRSLMPLVSRRLMDLPSPRPIKRKPMSQTARDKLYTRFRRSEPGRELGRDTSLVRALIDYGADQFDDALHWSPIVVELCLADWFPRKFALDDEDIERLPIVLRAWLKFTGTERGLSGPSIAEMLAAVDEFEPVYREATRDSAQAGPAKSIAALMMSDGVDLTDAGAVQDWIDAFNERPEDERIRLTGWSGS